MPSHAPQATPRQRFHATRHQGTGTQSAGSLQQPPSCTVVPPLWLWTSPPFPPLPQPLPTVTSSLTCSWPLAIRSYPLLITTSANSTRSTSDLPPPLAESLYQHTNCSHGLPAATGKSDYRRWLHPNLMSVAQRSRLATRHPTGILNSPCSGL